MKQYTLGIDVGGTKCAVILAKNNCDEKDMIISRKAFATEAKKGYKNTINNIFTTIDETIREYNVSVEDISGIGVSCGGPVDSKNGIVMNPPNLYGWDNIAIVKILGDKYNVPVVLQNDANACAVAEWKYGAAKGKNNVIFLTMGTGMGAGLILDGRLYSGTNDMAGEVGHIRLNNFGPVGFGKSGSFEGFCSGAGIAQIARTRALEQLQMGKTVGYCDSITMLDTISAKTVAIAADSGDEMAISVYKEVGYWLGMGISLLIDVLNPEIVVIGSIFERSSNLLEESMWEVINKEALRFSRDVCRVVPAMLGNKIGDYAAISIVDTEY